MPWHLVRRQRGECPAPRDKEAKTLTPGLPMEHALQPLLLLGVHQPRQTRPRRFLTRPPFTIPSPVKTAAGATFPESSLLSPCPLLQPTHVKAGSQEINTSQRKIIGKARESRAEPSPKWTWHAQPPLKPHVTVFCPEVAPRTTPQLWLPLSVRAENASRPQGCHGTADSPEQAVYRMPALPGWRGSGIPPDPLHLPNPHVPNHSPTGRVERGLFSALTLS